MDIFYEPHRILLAKLLEFKIDFILIGGYAVNFYGFNRPTGDMDIWLKSDATNKSKLLNLLKTYQFNKESIAYIEELDFSQTEVFCMGKPPVRVDFLTKISGIDYESADKEKVIADIDGMKIPVLHINHLILSKICNDRTKDKLDVEELQKIRQKKGR